MKQQPQIQAVDIHHNSLLFPQIAALIPVELQIAIFIETLLLVADWHIVEDIDLRGDLCMMGYQLYFADVDHPIELEGYLLGVGAEASCLPALGS